jgi:hypothetical protein
MSKLSPKESNYPWQFWNLGSQAEQQSYHNHEGLCNQKPSHKQKCRRFCNIAENRTKMGRRNDSRGIVRMTSLLSSGVGVSPQLKKKAEELLTGDAMREGPRSCTFEEALGAGEVDVRRVLGVNGIEHLLGQPRHELAAHRRHRVAPPPG